MEKANIDIREAAKKSKVPLWAIANAKGMHEVTFIRKLRFELPQEEKQSIFAIIERLEVTANREAGVR